MAVIANTHTIASSTRNREVFSNIIDRITPEETPFYSMLEKETVEGVKPEWQNETLRVPVLTNKHLEGDVYAYDPITATTRVGNYTQISRASIIVSHTQEAVSKAGPQSDLGREREKAGIGLRQDIEAGMLSNLPSIGGATRQSAGLRAWLKTNDFFGAGGASGGYNSGTGVVDVATVGTLRAFTKTLLDEAIAGAYASGGNPKIIMGSPWNKRQFSTFMADANVANLHVAATANEQATIMGAADAYLSDFGLMSFVPNRQMARAGSLVSPNVFLLDPDKIKKGFLRPIREDKDVNTNADADSRVMICEWTLMVTNEAAHAVVADVFGLTSAT